MRRITLDYICVYVCVYMYAYIIYINIYIYIYIYMITFVPIVLQHQFRESSTFDQFWRENRPDVVVAEIQREHVGKAFEAAY
jgi:hypothetical protein